jgi:hypothetical protein
VNDVFFRKAFCATLWLNDAYDRESTLVSTLLQIKLRNFPTTKGTFLEALRVEFGFGSFPTVEKAHDTILAGARFAQGRMTGIIE